MPPTPAVRPASRGKTAPKTPKSGGKTAAGSKTKKPDQPKDEIKQEDKKSAASSAMGRLTARPGADEVRCRPYPPSKLFSSLWMTRDFEKNRRPFPDMVVPTCAAKRLSGSSGSS